MNELGGRSFLPAHFPWTGEPERAHYDAVGAGVWLVFVFLWVATPIGPPTWPPPLFGLAILLLWGSFVVSQIYRYRRVSTPA